ncbi:MAG: YhbY family RNA-binding protein [Clostridia bacterium]|nr:YhbY family RNA-binding protein [Clostridia bacterium]
MITSKQRAYLRGLANGVPSICQIGKDGVTENLVKQLDSALTARELVKSNVLENAPCTAREACGELASLLSAEPVQVIGKVFVLYRQSKDEKKRTIVLKK